MKRSAVKFDIKHSAQTVTVAVAVCIFIISVLAFIVPLVAIPLKSVIFSKINSASNNGSTTSSFYSIKSLLKIIAFTFKQSLASTLLAVIVGIPAAFLVAKKNFFGRKLLLSFSSVPLCIPALIVALGYVSTFGMAGYINKFLMKIFSLQEPPLAFLYSFWGIVIAQGFYNFPLIMSTVADSWSSLPLEQAENARLLGASEGRVFRTITFYQILPSIISSCIPVFLYCFFSFMIVLLFGATGCTTLEVAIYHSAKSTLNFSDASILALIETLCALGIVFVYSVIEQKSIKNKGISFLDEQNTRTKISKKQMIPSFLFLFIILLFFVLPLFCILISSFTKRQGNSIIFTFANWKQLFLMNGFVKALLTTLTTALCVTVLCTVTAYVYAFFLRIKDPFSKNTFLRTIPLSPMAVSSVVMGLGMTMTVRRGSQLILILAETALSWPFAFRQIYAHLIKIPEPVLDQAKILSSCKTDALFRVCIPYSQKGIVSALGFCFAISAGDSTLPLVLAIPRFDTLALFTYRLAGNHKLNLSCAAGLLLGIICMAVFILSSKFKEAKENDK